MSDPNSHPPTPAHLSAKQSGHLALGAFCIVIGAIALWIAQGYEFGTFISMGPGFFPRVVSGGLILLGILIIADRGRDVDGEDPLPPMAKAALVRIGLCIIGSIIVFGLALKPLGLPIATFLMVALAMLAQHGVRPVTVVLTAFVLAAFAVLLFPILLGITVPVWPEGMR